MSIKDDFKPYTDSIGLIQDKPQDTNGPSGNGLLYTAEALCALADNNALGITDRSLFDHAFWLCEHPKEMGLMTRHPHAFEGDQEGPDDYHGCALASAMIDNGLLADHILLYGEHMGATKFDPAMQDDGTTRILFWDIQKRTIAKVLWNILSLGGLRPVKYVYNNINPGYFTIHAWLGRFPGLIANLRYAAGRKPNLVQFLFLVFGLLLGTRTAKDNHDGWTLPWVTYRTMQETQGHKNLIVKLAMYLWNRKFRQVWGNPGDLLAAYFNNPEHPSAKWLKNS